MKGFKTGLPCKIHKEQGQAGKKARETLKELEGGE
jgi:hypothetical protein